MKTKFLLTQCFFEFNCYEKNTIISEGLKLYACYFLENEWLSDFYGYFYQFNSNTTFEFIKLFKTL